MLLACSLLMLLFAACCRLVCSLIRQAWAQATRLLGAHCVAELLSDVQGALLSAAPAGSRLLAGYTR